LQQTGLTIIHPDESRSRHYLQVTNRLASLPPADIALILVKSHQTSRAARQARFNLKADGIAVTLQNGLGNVDILARAVGRQRAALGITAQGATVLQPGLLRHAGEGITYLAGREHQRDKLTHVATLFNTAGLETTLAENPDSLIWGKLAINAGINPLTALLNLPNGALVEDETLRRVMTAAANEVAQVAAAQGIRLPYNDAAKRTAEVSRATASNRSSMLQDISRAAPTEIDAISGAVVSAGQKLGIPTPVNQRLRDLIKAKELGTLATNPLDSLTLTPAF
jgi:2-dehydropantoate 2-reductase